MYVPESLKLNKFRVVAIPNAKILASRFGLVTPPKSAFTGDEDTSDLMSGNKADLLRDMAQFDAERAAKHE